MATKNAKNPSTAASALDKELPEKAARQRQNSPLPFSKEFYFFYGTLMDRKTLTRVLKLREQPELRPAKITGYHCMLWGEYPALVRADDDGSLNNDELVHGMAYEVQSPEDVGRLEAYETEYYENASCRIEFDDGREVAGRTFVWAGGDDTGELREGRSFDLKDWRLDNLERGFCEYGLVMM